MLSNHIVNISSKKLKVIWNLINLEAWESWINAKFTSPNPRWLNIANLFVTQQKVKPNPLKQNSNDNKDLF